MDAMVPEMDTLTVCEPPDVTHVSKGSQQQ